MLAVHKSTVTCNLNHKLASSRFDQQDTFHDVIWTDKLNIYPHTPVNQIEYSSKHSTTQEDPPPTKKHLTQQWDLPNQQELKILHQKHLITCNCNSNNITKKKKSSSSTPQKHDLHVPCIDDTLLLHDIYNHDIAISVMVHIFTATFLKSKILSTL